MLRKNILLAPDEPNQGGGLGELKTALLDIKKGIDGHGDKFKSIDEIIKGLQKDTDEIKKENNELKRRALSGPQIVEQRKPGSVTTECAKFLGAIVILAGAAHGKKCNAELTGWARKYVGGVIVARSEAEPNNKDLTRYAEVLKRGEAEGIITKDALTTSQIPLPVGYSAQIVELVEEYGTFRRYATVFPMGEATVNLPKLSSDPTFGFVDMSESIPEKQPGFEFVEFNAKKAGGLVRVPTELDMDSVVLLGQFIARYIARQLARWEDQVGWNADGSATYKLLKGVRQKILDNATFVQLGNGLNATEDITLEALRKIRSLVHDNARDMGAYYLHGSMESHLLNLTDDKNQKVYEPRAAQGAILDGFPVRWINRLPVLSSDALASEIAACFGDMAYWYMGQRGSIRIDTDMSVFFATDQMAVRGLERFTVGEMATDHMAGVKLAG